MTSTGGCFCGRVRYRISSAMGCRCALCKEAFTSRSSEYTEVHPDSFLWLSGEQNLTVFEYELGWGSCFCKTCGTTLCGMHQGKVHGVNLDTVDSDVRAEVH
jgi:hypothetical protein